MKRHCIRCSHSWVSRIRRRPAQCPKCKSQYWDKPYSGRTLKMFDRVRESRG